MSETVDFTTHTEPISMEKFSFVVCCSCCVISIKEKKRKEICFKGGKGLRKTVGL